MGKTTATNQGEKTSSENKPVIMNETLRQFGRMMGPTDENSSVGGVYALKEDIGELMKGEKYEAAATRALDNGFNREMHEAGAKFYGQIINQRPPDYLSIALRARNKYNLTEDEVREVVLGTCKDFLVGGKRSLARETLEDAKGIVNISKEDIIKMEKEAKEETKNPLRAGLMKLRRSLAD